MKKVLIVIFIVIILLIIGTVCIYKLKEKISQDKEKVSQETKRLELLEMREVDNYIFDIVNSDKYSNLSMAGKRSFMNDELNKLATTGTDRFRKPLIKEITIQYSGNFSFQYAKGGLGGVIITDSNLTYTIDNNMNNYDSNYSKRGVYYDTANRPNAPQYFIISMGKQNTGGYSINIEKVDTDENGNIEIIVKEIKPTSNDIVTEAITYPICQLELQGRTNKNVIIKNTEGEEFKII